MALPSGYVSCSGLYTRSYIDTGIVPKDTLSVDLLCYPLTGYIMGARNSNSNTSAGQFGLSLGNSETCYFCWKSTRTQIASSGGLLCGMTKFHTESNVFELVDSNTKIIKKTLATGSFTGTKNIYLFAFNNAGTVVGTDSSKVIFACSIKDDGVVVRDFAPAFETATSKYGMYDMENNTFYPLSSVEETMNLVTIQQTTGGYGYIETHNAGNVTEQYGGASSEILAKSEALFVKCKAMSDRGYVFFRWEDSNGNVLSTDSTFYFYPTSNTTVVPVFLKKSEQRQYLGSKCIGIQYGEYRNASTDFRADIYADVISASFKNDLLQKATSTIVLKEVPSLYQTGMPVFVMDARGRNIYCGIIQSIDGNTLTCREPLSLYDNEFLFHNNTSVFGSNYNLTLYSVMYTMYQYLSSYNQSTEYLASPYLTDKMLQRYVGQSYFTEDRIVPFNQSEVFSYLTPLQSEVKVWNREEYFFDLYNMFGIFAQPSLLTFKLYNNYPLRHIMGLNVVYYKALSRIVLGNNVESISNVSIVSEDAENTILHVYNSSGTSIRACYGMDNDGNIVAYDSTSNVTNMIGYKLCKLKVVTTDDDLDVVKEQYLNNSFYNHKITFDLNFDTDAYSYNDLEIGQRCTFYYGDKVYNSVITGIDFDLLENDDEIHSAKITLGKVRTNLTSKLNLGKVK